MKELLQGCRKLDRKAQREMVNHLSPFLFPLCRRYSNTQEDAKDLLQEALILIFNNIKQCSSNEKRVFLGWCRRIAINNALAKKRKKGFEMKAIEKAEIANGQAPIINSKLNVDDILNLLNILPTNQRMVFNLAVVDGYTHKEIAKLLAIKESNSRTLLTRARQTLQSLINKERKLRKVSK